MPEVVIGIDLGTQGARVLAVGRAGEVVASAHQPLPPAPGNLPPGWLEQHPQDWWQAIKLCLRRLMDSLPAQTIIAGICVDSTSGTVLPVDADGEPLSPAIMYNDRRSETQARKVQTAGADHQKKLGYIFGSSYALPKILWLQEHRTEIFSKARCFLHAADWLAGRLTGRFDLSDTSNALKAGYDLVDLRWPEFIERDLNIPLERLPQVILPGGFFGQVTGKAAEATGLPEGVPLFAGATDGTAAQIASGATQPGEWNSTLGTTLVLKGISETLVLDPQGRIYSHRHPQGGHSQPCWWMPGGASNTGAEWIALDAPGEDPAELDRLAEACVPTRLVRYPLARRGERFPFVCALAEGFLLGDPSNPIERHAAGLEGLALVERLAYDTLQGLGLEVGERVYITGGGSRSNLWSQVRASILGRTLLRPVVPETAMGAAILAASGCWYASLSEAAASMVKVAAALSPVPGWIAAYEEKFGTFVNEITRKGYLSYI